MTNKELQAITNRISLEYFNESIHDGTLNAVRFNPRFRTSGGRFSIHFRKIIDRPFTHNDGVPDLDDVDEFIEINPKLVSMPKNLIGTIKHELCHWYIWNHYHEHGHGALFMRYLHLIGGTRYAPMTESEKQQPIYIYRCQKCGNVFARQRRFNTNKFACGRCKGHLALVKQITFAQAIKQGYLRLAK